jgi:hypothetical protein
MGAVHGKGEPPGDITAVLIGMGERTTPMAVEILARALFSKAQARTVIAVELPRSHAMMHLDTVMTMIDRSTFVLYPSTTGTFGRGLSPPRRMVRNCGSAAMLTSGRRSRQCWTPARSRC